jgi:acyl dehydratase
MNTLYLDDLAPGQIFKTNGFTFTEAEIIDFAWRYDPQPFHIDTGAAEKSPYGGLIASGFQSLSICFRLFIQSGIFMDSSLGGSGIDELRWHV